jgi:enoyl-CoA hydratase/carnithine racemase
VLHIQHHEDVAEIRMDRPPANALNHALVDELLAALDTLQASGARALILTGRPGMFSGGLDVPALIDCKRPEIEHFWQQFFRLSGRLAASPVPVIAALSGHAPAGGAVLALQCDYRIGINGNFKIGLNEVQVGLPVPGTILLALEEVIGLRHARRIATRGTLLPMAEALSIGLVDELVEADVLIPTALVRARELLGLPPVAMNTTRLAGKARLIEAYANGSDVVTATDWWFSAETQAEMRKLVERLGKK